MVIWQKLDKENADRLIEHEVYIVLFDGTFFPYSIRVVGTDGAWRAVLFYPGMELHGIEAHGLTKEDAAYGAVLAARGKNISEEVFCSIRAQLKSNFLGHKGYVLLENIAHDVISRLPAKTIDTMKASLDCSIPDCSIHEERTSLPLVIGIIKEMLCGELKKG